MLWGTIYIKSLNILLDLDHPWRLRVFKERLNHLRL